MGKIINVFENNCIRAWTDENGVGRVYFKIKSNVTHEDFLNYIKNVEKLSRGKPRPVLIDIMNIGFVSDPAFTQMITDKKTIKLTKAAAVLVASPSMRVMFFLDFLLKMKIPPFPSKIFLNEKKALQWLEQYK